MPSPPSTKDSSNPLTIASHVVDVQPSQGMNVALISRPTIQDPLYPYYLHQADDPDNILVSQLHSEQDNYTDLSRVIKV